jgi:hypothetical protein
MPFHDPVTGGNGQGESDQRRAGIEQTDLIAVTAQTSGENFQKVDGGSCQDSIPTHVKIKMDEVGTVFSGNGAFENFGKHGMIIMFESTSATCQVSCVIGYVRTFKVRKAD